MAQKIFDTDLRIGGPSGPLLIVGAGSPEGAVTAPVASEYWRSDGVLGSTRYLKVSGSGNTGWVAVATGAHVPIHVGTTAPSSPAVNDVWIDSN